MGVMTAAFGAVGLKYSQYVVFETDIGGAGALAFREYIGLVGAGEKKAPEKKYSRDCGYPDIG